MLKAKKQLSKLYTTSILGNLSLTGAWVAILASRGFSLVEISIAETVFHITSLMFEIPSGVFADVFGRKRMLIVSTLLHMVSSILMILSQNLFMVCLAIAFVALTYNASSGSDDALAFDTLKLFGEEKHFEKYKSNQMILYRLCSGISTLCAGFALVIGHRIAYATGLITCMIQLVILMSLQEVSFNKADDTSQPRIGARLLACFKESFSFLFHARKAFKFMFSNSFVGAIDVLLLFFLQAKLPECGMLGLQLGLALLFMELGGIVGSRLILKLTKIRYQWLFGAATLLVLTGLLLEHSGIGWIMALGGFLAATADDALQVRTNSILQSMFPSEQRATLISVDSFCFSCIMIVLTPLAGFFFTIW